MKIRNKKSGNLKNNIASNKLIKNKMALLRKTEVIIPIILLISITLFIFVSGVVLTGDSSYNATLNGNITQETGYVHLNLSTSSPYDTLKNYWSFDKDTTTAFDWQVPGNDLTYGSGSTNLQNGLYNDYANISATGGTNLATSTGLLDDTSGSLSIWLYPAALTGGATAIGAQTSVRFGLLLES